MPHKSEKFLRDMVDRGVRIQAYTSGKTRADFLKDAALQDAVHWNLCVIGEAMAQLRQLDPAAAAQFTAYAKIIGLRNQLIHGYGSIDTDITWAILEKHLPILIQELRSVLGP